MFAHHRQRFATGGHDRDARRRPKDPLDQLGDRLHEVLTVVEQQQGAAGAEHVDDRILDRQAEAGVHAQRSRDRCEGRIAVVDRHQLDDEDAIGVVRRDRPGQLHPERRLAHTGAPHQRDEPALAEFFDQCRQELVTADQPLQGDRQIARRLVEGVAPIVVAVTRVGPPVDDPDLGDELVALAVHGADDGLPGAVVADRSTRRLHPRRERRLADETIAPDLVEEFLLAHHLAVALGEELQDVEHLWLHRHLAAATAQHDPVEVEFAVVEFDDHPHAPRR